MEFQTLKRSHLKRDIIIGVIAVLIISAVVLNFTRAKYRTTESIPLVNGTINYSLADFNAVAIYINTDSGYTKSDTIPDGYVLNEEESYCTVNGEEDTNISLSYDTSTKSLSVTPMTTKGTKCYLYFDEKGMSGFDYAYLYPGMNKVMQAAGRVIRTDTDRGMIFLLDDRFLLRQYRAVFPREWSKAFSIRLPQTAEAVAAFWDETRTQP